MKTTLIAVATATGRLPDLQRFFQALGNLRGPAYVVMVHHLPDFNLLKRQLADWDTSLAVRVVEEDTRVEPDSIYLVPAGQSLDVSEGRLRPGGPSGFVVDELLMALVQECRGRSIAVMLAPGSRDGYRGTRAVKAAGGLVLAQAEVGLEPYPGVADLALPPEQMPQVIQRFLNPPALESLPTDVHFELVSCLRQQCHLDFSAYRAETVNRAAARRMQLAGIREPASYLAFLGDSPAETEALMQELRVQPSRFFDESGPWDTLAGSVIPHLLSAAPAESELRFWVTPCATGEDAYSLALLLSERLEGTGVRARIYATDFDPAVVRIARAGEYPESLVADVPEGLRSGAWLKTAGACKVLPTVRGTIVFACHDLLADPPFSRLDLIYCHSLLNRLTPGGQQRALTAMHYALRPGGLLLLGGDESPEEIPGAFLPWDGGQGVLLKDSSVRLAMPLSRLATPEEEVWSQPGDQEATVAALLAATRELQTANDDLQAANEDLQANRLEADDLRRRLAKASSDLQNLQQCIGGGSFFVDRDLRVSRLTEAARQSLGLEPWKAGGTLEELNPLLSAVDLPARVREVVDTAQPCSLQVANTRGRVFRLGIFPRLNPDGAPEGAVISLEATPDADTVRADAERFELAARGAEGGLWHWDVPRDRMWVSPRFQELLGREALPEDASRQSWWQHIHPQDREQAEQSLREHLEEDAPLNTVFRVRHGSGSYRWCHCRSAVWRGRHGEPLVVAGSLQDVTQRHQAEQALVARNLELLAATRSKSEFLANMSHELRTPLNSILGMAEMLVDGMLGPLNSKQQEYCQDVFACGHHLLTLINEILDLAKIEAGKLELEPEDFDLCEIFGNCLNVVREAAAARAVSLHLKTENLASAHLDARRLKQILYNLLSNAVKFTSEGGRVTLEASFGEGWLEFSVQDTGVGIPSEEIPRILRPFEQLDGSLSRHYEGTGLGLALVTRLVDLFGGDLSIESEVGKGSRFLVRLPVAEGLSPVSAGNFI